MKMVCVIGSPRPEGNTVYLVDRVISGMKKSGNEVKKYVLGNMNINFCLGCRSCETNRRCVQRDDMDGIIDSIMEADLLLLASPSYWGDVSGQMKTFIDRSLPLCNATTGQTPVPAGKSGVAIAIRAGNSKSENIHIVETFRHYFGHLGIDMIASLTVEGVSDAQDFENKTEQIKQAYELGGHLMEKRAGQK